MIQHRSKHGIKRKLRVEKRCSFEQQIELAKAAAHWLRTGNVLDACEQIRKRLLAARRAGSKNNLVGIFKTETDRVAVIQQPAFHFLAVDEKSPALPAIFDVQAPRFDNESRAIPRNAPVGELKMVARYRAAPDQKWCLRHADVPPRAVW